MISRPSSHWNRPHLWSSSLFGTVLSSCLLACGPCLASLGKRHQMPQMSSPLRVALNLGSTALVGSFPLPSSRGPRPSWGPPTPSALLGPRGAVHVDPLRGCGFSLSASPHHRVSVRFVRPGRRPVSPFLCQRPVCLSMFANLCQRRKKLSKVLRSLSNSTESNPSRCSQNKLDTVKY